MLYYFFSLLLGLLISIMITLNGLLTSHYGIYIGTVLIHFIGLLFVSFWAIKKKDPLFKYKTSFLYYTGGIIGVITVVFSNKSFGHILLSAIIALGLLGQIITSILIDEFGWFDMEKVPFEKKKIFGLVFFLFGLYLMMRGSPFVLLPVIMSFITGVSSVLSRVVNGHLAKTTSTLTSTWFNYFTGLITSILLLALVASKEINTLHRLPTPPLYFFTGSLFGFIIVYLTNIVTVKISQLYMSILVFIGQIFTGIVIDYLLFGNYASNILFGGLLMICGQSINLIIDYRQKRNLLSIKKEP